RDSRRDSHSRDSHSRDSHSRDSHGRHSFRESVSSESFSHLTLGEEEEEDDGEEEEEEERREERSGNTEEVEQVLQEAQEVRREIQLLKLDVKRLRDQNARLLSNPCATSEGHQDANAIGQEIKTRGEEVLGRLRQMDERSRRREEELGVNAVAARIGRTQYVCLSNGFRDAMRDYQQAETSHREACSNHIRRQMEIVGRDLSSEQLDDMMESGQWNVFADNLLTEGKTARTALNQIERRHQDLLDLERRIRSVHEVFLDVAMLLEEQGAMATSIQLTVEQTEVATGDAVAKIESAKKYDRKNPLKKLMFWRR
ncbi:syntaxin-11-like, partial [Engraulis encrasicolus]|uniref:syntaxin-11-like n=1 Tax=Engraulis encrasicolus TaxID=184585 RepID=UPI002FCF255E